ncbi:MAG: 1,4-beta-xylanase, partial [Rhodospirillaceae bacterium]|nr:1,4-beta-xylanase [Rhodospirillaceae bacterium]
SYPAAGVAAGVLVASHSIVDFSLQIPAVSVVFAAMLGAACAQSRSSSEAEPYLHHMHR